MIGSRRERTSGLPGARVRLIVVSVATLGALLAASAYAQPPVAAADPGQWLNVKDHGASGSEYQTIASTTEGSNEIVVEDVGDLQAGQGVQISKAYVHYERQLIWGPDYARGKALKDEVEMRGYDGTSGSWTPFLVKVHPEEPASFRFTDDIGRTYSEFVPITGDWQPLSGGTEIKFNRREWDGAYLVTFSARDQLVTVIEKIEGNTLTLRDPANRTVQDAVVQHNDSTALQAVIDRAIKEKRNVYFPPGRYRLAHGLTVKDASCVTIQGADPVTTIIDISMAEGACFSLRGGEDVTLRNFRLVGHTGYDRKDQCGNMNIKRVPAMWGMYLKGCNAVSIRDTERVLVENCHARQMATEAFYSQGRSRMGHDEPAHYTKEITYLRCSCEDCGRNVFNNNDMCENTSVLYCRIRDVGGCTWEGASRFVRFIGNYVRNGGTVAMGNISSRDERFEILASGQHIVADNVFETGVNYGGCAIRAAHAANQVIIRNNLFINYGTSAIELTGRTSDRAFPARNCTITGNIMDMTRVEEGEKERYAIQVSASGTVVSDNQIYVRGECDPQVSAIRLYEPAINVQVQGNLISNCGYGIVTGRCRSRVLEVIDQNTFIPAQSTLPFEWHRSHRYRGWRISWMSGDTNLGLSTIEEFDPETLQFRLTEPREMKAGDNFELFPAMGANWSISGNIITGCLHPLVLDSYGSETSIVRGNVISRGEVSGVERAAEVRGWFKLIGNHFAGFDEPDCSALALHADRAGRDVRSVFVRNIFERCANVVAEAEEGIWEASLVADNLFLDCGTAPEKGTAALPEGPPLTVTTLRPKPRPILIAPRLARPVTVDGEVGEWPWKDEARVITLAQTPAGNPTNAPGAYACAGVDGDSLYLALRVPVPEGTTLIPHNAGWRGDGVEVSFQSPDAKAPSPVFVLWGSVGGSFEAAPEGGASTEQIEALRRAVSYAAREGKGEWTCEWQIPLAAIAPDPGEIEGLLFNVGVRRAASSRWVAWVGTGAEIFRVERAGELLLQR